MSTYKLVTFESCATLPDDTYGNDTASLEQYGLRHGGILSEYDIALRLQKVRYAALELIEMLTSEGYGISREILELIDVETEVTTTKRFNIDRRK